MADAISPELRGVMNALAGGLDKALNGEVHAKDPKVGFVLLTFNFGAYEGGRVNYISNANRADILAATKEWIARAEGRMTGEAGRS